MRILWESERGRRDERGILALFAPGGGAAKKESSRAIFAAVLSLGKAGAFCLSQCRLVHCRHNLIIGAPGRWIHTESEHQNHDARFGSLHRSYQEV